MSLAQAEAFNPSKALYLARPKGYVVLNSSPIARDVTWGGNIFTIPPRDQIVKPHPKFQDDPTVPHSARYKDTEEFIPGTLFIQDNDGRNERFGDQSVHKPWMSAEALKGAFGVDEYDNITGVLYQQGLSILPQDPPKELVIKADHAGRQRYREWQLKNATQIVADFERKNDKRKGYNMSPMAPPAEVREAQALLSNEDVKFRAALRQEEKAEAELRERELERTASQSTLTPSLPPEPDAASIAEQIAKDPSILMDPKLRSALSEEFTIRKRRVPKSKQTRTAVKAKKKVSKLTRSAAIQIPED